MKSGTNYYEIWSDTVSLRDLAYSTLICVVASMVSYFAGYETISRIIPKLEVDLLKGYSLLCGLIGTVIAAIIAAKIYKPKRILTESIIEEAQFLEALAEQGISIADELDALQQLPIEVKRELDEIGMFEKMTEILQNNKSS
jgi:hypothetical protein